MGMGGTYQWQNILCLQIKVYVSKKDLKVKIYLDCI